MIRLDTQMNPANPQEERRTGRRDRMPAMSARAAKRQITSATGSVYRTIDRRSGTITVRR